jgi:hypothetical protein
LVGWLVTNGVTTIVTASESGNSDPISGTTPDLEICEGCGGGLPHQGGGGAYSPTLVCDGSVRGGNNGGDGGGGGVVVVVVVLEDGTG